MGNNSSYDLSSPHSYALEERKMPQEDSITLGGKVGIQGIHGVPPPVREISDVNMRNASIKLITPEIIIDIKIIADIIQMLSKEKELPNGIEFNGAELNRLNEEFRDIPIYGAIMITIESRADNRNLLKIYDNILINAVRRGNGYMSGYSEKEIVYMNIKNKRGISLFKSPYTFIRENDCVTDDIKTLCISSTLSINSAIDSIPSTCTTTYTPPVPTPSNSRNNILQKLEDVKSRDKEEENDEYACVSCMERKKIVIVLPCSHIIYCVQCAIQNFNNELKCPVCTVETENVIITY